MSNEEKIIERIIADAQEERDKIINQAKKIADDIIEKAEEAAEKEMLSANEQALTEAEKASSKVISGAQMEAKTAILTQKQQSLSETLTKAKNKLYNLSTQEYLEVVLKMLEKAEDGEIVLSDKDNKSLSSALLEKGYTVSDEIRDIDGGFIVKKGEIEYNYSFEAIMSVEKEQIEQIAAEILFR